MKNDKELLKSLSAEARELEERINKLRVFLDDFACDLPITDFRLLTTQYTVMTSYFFILGMRIDKVKGKF